MQLNHIDTDKLTRMKGLDPEFLIHPMDKEALRALKQVPVLDIVIKKLLEHGFEKYIYIQNIADNVRVSPKQCKRIYDMTATAADILDLEIPEVYISQNPIANAMTSGVSKPFIILYSGLIELLEDEELYAVIAHELGHIKCNHVLYRTLANILLQVFSLVGQSTLGIGNIIGSGLILVLLEWYRKSELSADRAAMLAVQDHDVIINVNMKLAGGSKSLYKELNKEEFLKQADDYRDLDKDTISQVYKIMTLANLTHPHTILRAREAYEWAQTEDYKNAIQGNYPKAENVCVACQKVSPEPFTFCPYCGANNANEPNSCKNCKKEIEDGVNFCPYCGSSVGQQAV
jgi:Zn-dependent protease with chaperone function/RNA polymerase subunit RPABC4/transcription elongation factor Spt4